MPAKKKRKVDVEHMRKIGKLGARVMKKKGSAYFSRIAKLSHKKNNRKAKRDGYHGGRPETEV